jgi:hypothetical protein
MLVGTFNVYRWLTTFLDILLIDVKISEERVIKALNRGIEYWDINQYGGQRWRNGVNYPHRVRTDTISDLGKVHTTKSNERPQLN